MFLGGRLPTPRSLCQIPASTLDFSLYFSLPGWFEPSIGHRVSFRRSFAVPALATRCVILLRVNVDVTVDTTSHNLWSFEVVLASMVGFGVLLGGALRGSGTALGYVEEIHPYLVGTPFTPDWEIVFADEVHAYAAGARSRHAFFVRWQSKCWQPSAT